MNYKNEFIKVFNITGAGTIAVQKFAEVFGDDRSEESFKDIVENYNGLEARFVLNFLWDEVIENEYHLLLSYSLDGGDMTEAEVKEMLSEIYSSFRKAILELK